MERLPDGSRVRTTAKTRVRGPRSLGRNLLWHGLHKDVERHIQMHWSRSTSNHHIIGLPERQWEHIWPGWLITTLHIGPHNINKISLEILARFLEWSAVPL